MTLRYDKLRKDVVRWVNTPNGDNEVRALLGPVEMKFGPRELVPSLPEHFSEVVTEALARLESKAFAALLNGGAMLRTGFENGEFRCAPVDVRYPIYRTDVGA